MSRATERVLSMRARQLVLTSCLGTSEGQHVLPAALEWRICRIFASISSSLTSGGPGALW
eukprot:CAMPEP_0205940918 /NCGR_PEP_ID=MMETSP1325-20131115/53591_1 /ASSEMBLY_ACC=CAM_ASM_000708 /TAXON_ID=236786 /ORGANISM="Florenciella sp., Strain RCC1007" /LENGTH=59 /DNA_ID=CAMNT_0053311515 /DNA_START=180 /DNA_END=356 /DNA_ORIENTATION=-